MCTHLTHVGNRIQIDAGLKPVTTTCVFTCCQLVNLGLIGWTVQIFRRWGIILTLLV